MSAPITADDVRHLAELARMDLTPEEEARLMRDLGNILGHFTELQEVKTDTDRKASATRGHSLRSVFREDDEHEKTNQGSGVDAFPAAENNLLKVPPVFE